jgi:hypothetical protein
MTHRPTALLALGALLLGGACGSKAADPCTAMRTRQVADEAAVNAASAADTSTYNALVAKANADRAAALAAGCEVSDI